MTSRRNVSVARLVRGLGAAGVWLAVALPVFAASAPAPGGITIVAATYGVDTRVVDVTSQVAGLVRPGSDPVVVGAAAFGVKDPAPLAAGKSVVITYNYGLQTKTVTFPDGLMLSQPILVQFATAALVSPGAKLQALNEEQLAGVVFIQGDKSLATGFIARLHDIDCVVTDLHVLVENEKITVKNLAGGVLETSGLIGAVGADLALLQIARPAAKPPALLIAGNVLQSARIADRVVVVGNHPDGVATQTGGLVTGFGPDRLEVDAAFQLGNCGSPVFDLVSQQVVGVATFRDTTVLDSEGLPPRAADPAVRHWFGGRLDAVGRWETVDWTKWRAQIRRLNEFHDASLALLALYRGSLTEAARDLHLRAVIARFKSRLTPSELGEIGTSPYSTEQVREMVREALAYAKDGADDLAGIEFYDYFRTGQFWAVNVPDQVKFRAQLIKGFAAVDSDLRPYERRLTP
jgi:S1-C subfamily serine protease